MWSVHIKFASTVVAGCTSRILPTRQLPSFQVPMPRLESSLELRRLMDMDGLESGYGCYFQLFSLPKKDARRRDSVSLASHHDGRSTKKLSRCLWIASLYLMLAQQLQVDLFVAHTCAEILRRCLAVSLGESGSPICRCAGVLREPPQHSYEVTIVS